MRTKEKVKDGFQRSDKEYIEQCRKREKPEKEENGFDEFGFYNPFYRRQGNDNKEM